MHAGCSPYLLGLCTATYTYNGTCVDENPSQPVFYAPSCRISDGPFLTCDGPYLSSLATQVPCAFEQFPSITRQFVGMCGAGCVGRR